MIDSEVNMLSKFDLKARLSASADKVVDITMQIDSVCVLFDINTLIGHAEAQSYQIFCFIVTQKTRQYERQKKKGCQGKQTTSHCISL